MRNRVILAVAILAAAPRAVAGNDALGGATTARAPHVNPHSLQLDLDFHARRHSRGSGTFESSGLLDLAPGLSPLPFPRNSDMRARLLTPELKRAPVVGWIATNLYRSRRESGWCLEVDPGEGEYLVFYRVNL